MSIQMNLDNGSEKIKGYVKSQSDSNRAFRASGAYKEVKQEIETLDLDDLQEADSNISSDSSESLDISTTTNKKIDWESLLASKSYTSFRRNIRQDNLVQFIEDTGAKVIEKFNSIPVAKSFIGGLASILDIESSKESLKPDILDAITSIPEVKSFIERLASSSVVKSFKGIAKSLMEKINSTPNENKTIKSEKILEEMSEKAIEYLNAKEGKEIDENYLKILGDGSVLYWEHGDSYIRYFPDGSYSEIYLGYGIYEPPKVKYYDSQGNIYRIDNYYSEGITMEDFETRKPDDVEVLIGNKWEIYSDGILIGERFEDSDEYTYYYKNGNKESERLADGTRRKWYENGILSEETLADGTIREWYENGNKKSEHLADGTIREWYENGILSKEEIDPDNIKTYDENGKLIYEEKNGESIFEIDENGNIKTEIINGRTINYNEDGTINDIGHHLLGFMEENAKCQIRGGSLKKTSIGSLQIVDKDGNVTAEILQNGYMILYGKDGELWIYGNYLSNTNRYSYEVLQNGEIIIYELDEDITNDFKNNIENYY